MIGNLMPGVRYIALQDYQELNMVPVDIARFVSPPDADKDSP